MVLLGFSYLNRQGCCNSGITCVKGVKPTEEAQELGRVQPQWVKEGESAVLDRFAPTTWFCLSFFFALLKGLLGHYRIRS